MPTFIQPDPRRNIVIIFSAKKKEYTLEGVSPLPPVPISYQILKRLSDNPRRRSPPQTLGTGSFGKVVRATWHHAPPPGPPTRSVALKVIPKKLVRGEEKGVFDEIQVLKGLDHEGVVKCFDHFESRDKWVSTLLRAG